MTVHKNSQLDAVMNLNNIVPCLLLGLVLAPIDISKPKSPNGPLSFSIYG